MSGIHTTNEELPSTQIGAQYEIVKELVGFCKQLDFENNPREAFAQVCTLILLLWILAYIS